MSSDVQGDWGGPHCAGKEIQEDLMKLLQNKLDDTVLDVISIMLARNPQCKLRPEDVQVTAWDTFSIFALNCYS